LTNARPRLAGRMNRFSAKNDIVQIVEAHVFSATIQAASHLQHHRMEIAVAASYF